MRIALLADIHGNSIALDAVLADIERRGGVDGYWLLGDYCAIGFDPAGVVERLLALPNATFIRGNSERYLVSGERPNPTFERVAEKTDLIPLLAEVHGHFGWIAGHLAGRGYFEWLKTLPFEQRVTLPDGTRVLLVHGSPSYDAGSGLNPTVSDDRAHELIGDAQADVIGVGHFHMTMDRWLDGLRIINPGSVSNHLTSDIRASYAILTAEAQGYDVAFHRVAYDNAAALAATRSCGILGAEFICTLLQGQDAGEWMADWDGVTFAPTITP